RPAAPRRVSRRRSSSSQRTIAELTHHRRFPTNSCTISVVALIEHNNPENDKNQFVNIQNAVVQPRRLAGQAPLLRRRLVASMVSRLFSVGVLSRRVISVHVMSSPSAIPRRIVLPSSTAYTSTSLRKLPRRLAADLPCVASTPSTAVTTRLHLPFIETVNRQSDNYVKRSTSTPVFHTFISTVAERTGVVVSIDYRLASETPLRDLLFKYRHWGT
ncbi:alpha/beta-Hydrolases superfamily protein, partial [Striga asiatica]